MCSIVFFGYSSLGEGFSHSVGFFLFGVHLLGERVGIYCDSSLDLADACKCLTSSFFTTWLVETVENLVQ